MEPRTLWFVGVLLATGSYGILAEEEKGLDATEEPGAAVETSEEQRVLAECRHPNYKTYIKCLKRQRRHHLTHDSDRHGEIDTHCMESCLKRCESETDCDQGCNNHCARRTKHRHQIITEYEIDCSSGHCVEKDSNQPTNQVGPGVTNITTNIDINNVINNCQPCEPGARTCSCVPVETDHGRNTTSTTGCKTCPPYPEPQLPIGPRVTPFNSFLPSQLTLVPQLTLGIGLSPGIGPCLYPNQWPCSPYHQQDIDCSGCGNPFLRYKCDVSCYTTNGQPIPAHGTSVNRLCQSPHCVGGAR